jgi:hypothetical protein
MKHVPSVFWIGLVGVGAAFAVMWQLPTRQRVRYQAKHEQLRSDLQEIEKAVARAALALNTPAATELTPDQWRPHLAPTARAELREKGTDPFGSPYGPQLTDRPVRRQ